MQARFNFVGKVVIPRNSVREFTTGNGLKGVNYSFGVKDANGYVGFVSMLGFIGEGDIRTRDTSNKEIIVPYESRFDKEIVSQVASYRKTSVNLTGERKEYINTIDMIHDLYDILQPDMPIVVVGNADIRYYNGSYSMSFTPSGIYAPNEEQKSILTVSAEIYYNKDCIDGADWKKERVVRLNGYVPQYVFELRETKFMPYTFVFNASKIDVEDKLQKEAMDYRLRNINVKTSKYQHVMWKCRYIDGAEEVAFDESMLTNAQKEQIELGLATIDEFKPKTIFGNRKVELRLISPVLQGDFSSGLKEADMTTEEFEANIYRPGVTREEHREVKKPEQKAKSVIEDLDDIFG